MNELSDDTEIWGALLVGRRTLASVVVFRNACTRGTLRVRAEIPAEGFPTDGLVIELPGNRRVRLKDFEQCSALPPGEVHYHFVVAK
jgi:hypothetical protein